MICLYEGIFVWPLKHLTSRSLFDCLPDSDQCNEDEEQSLNLQFHFLTLGI